MEPYHHISPEILQPTSQGTAIENIDTLKTPISPENRAANDDHNTLLSADLPTLPLPIPKLPENRHFTGMAQSTPHHPVMTSGRATLSIVLLCIALLQVINLGSAQFIGSQGWAYIIGGPVSRGAPNLLKVVNIKSTSKKLQFTPEQYINLIVQKMTLDQKLGQMMFVQFIGPSYSFSLSTMISQYHVGAAIIFTTNGNVVSKAQLKDLVQQMQSNSYPLPLAVAIDQEGGYVDRLLPLDGPRPAAATIGATNDPAKATAEGIEDAQDLSYYGINLNLAPVADVDSIYASELHRDLRMYGSNPTTVTKMVGAYLQGLQQSGKVIGTLKHFPGLGSVATDPHNGLPLLLRSRNDLEQIDWAPYRTLIQQGSVHAVMVTHEIVAAVDNSIPSSLSTKVVNGILRDEMGFQGVIMTDSLTMESVMSNYSPGQSAALSIEAGCDLIMGASTPEEVATMITGIKQAINAGTISQQRIDASVQRILMMKYEMGLLPIPRK